MLDINISKVTDYIYNNRYPEKEERSKESQEIRTSLKQYEKLNINKGILCRDISISKMKIRQVIIPGNSIKEVL